MSTVGIPTLEATTVTASRHRRAAARQEERAVDRVIGELGLTPNTPPLQTVERCIALDAWHATFHGNAWRFTHRRRP